MVIVYNIKSVAHTIKMNSTKTFLYKPIQILI